MRTQSPDTSPEAERVLIELLRQAPAWRKLRMVEDTVLAKLQGYREGGAVFDRQWNDVLGVLKVQAPTLDRAYLREWARELKLTDLFDRALDDAWLPPDS